MSVRPTTLKDVRRTRGASACKVASGYRPGISTGTQPDLLVPAQPQWLQVMSDSEVEISSELLWSCIAAGKPRPSVRWLRNGQPIGTQV